MNQVQPTQTGAGAGRGGQGGPTAAQATGAVAAQPKPAAKKDPAVEKRQKELIAAGAQIKADGYPGPKTDAAEAEFGWKTNQAPAATGPGNAPAAAATDATSLAAAQGKEPAADPNAPEQSTMADGPAVGSQGPTAQDAVEKAKIGIMGGKPADPTAQAAPPASGQSQDEIARLQQLGGMNAQVANPFAPKPPTTGQAAQPTAAADPTAADPTAAVNPMAGVKPAGAAAAQPAAAPLSTVQPDVKSADGAVKSGSGGNVKSSSDLQLAWRSLQPQNRSMPYPGDAVAQQQVSARDAAGQKNMDTLKGVGNKISNFLGGNKQPAAAPAEQYNRLKDPNSLTRGFTPKTTPAIATFENEELSRIVSLIRHR
jgi:hypothetical protein